MSDKHPLSHPRNDQICTKVPRLLKLNELSDKQDKYLLAYGLLLFIYLDSQHSHFWSLSLSLLLVWAIRSLSLWLLLVWAIWSLSLSLLLVWAIGSLSYGQSDHYPSHCYRNQNIQALGWSRKGIKQALGWSRKGIPRWMTTVAQALINKACRLEEPRPILSMHFGLTSLPQPSFYKKSHVSLLFLYRPQPCLRGLWISYH